MRTSVLHSLMDIAKQDPSMILITGDLGFGLFEPFIALYPQQFLNLGIAEQNMIGVAAGLALSGKKVFVYSIGNFPSFRCLEQIRNDLCYHNLNVNIIALGGGYNYGGLGMSHHATEDLSIMRSLPNITVVAPSNANDAGQAILALYERTGPSYLRLEKCNVESYSDKNFEVGKANTIYEGIDCCIIAIGGITSEAMLAAKKLSKEQNIYCSVIDMHTLKPLDKVTCVALTKKYKVIITVEENTLLGGLYGAIAEVIASLNINCQLIPIGINDHYSSIVGDQAYLRSYYNIDNQAIYKTTLTHLKN